MDFRLFGTSQGQHTVTLSTWIQCGDQLISLMMCGLSAVGSEPLDHKPFSFPKSNHILFALSL